MSPPLSGRQFYVGERSPVSRLEKSLVHDLEALGLGRPGPQRIRAGHRHCALRACPPGVVDFFALPANEGRDFLRVGEGEESLARDEAREPALSEAVAIEKA